MTNKGINTEENVNCDNTIRKSSAVIEEAHLTRWGVGGISEGILFSLMRRNLSCKGKERKCSR